MSRKKPGDQEPLDAEIVGEPAPARPGAVARPDATALPAPLDLPDPDYSDGGVPSFDFVRDRIENRYTTSVGAQEIAGLGGKEDLASLDKKIADRDKAAKDKLAEIRRAMGRE